MAAQPPAGKFYGQFAPPERLTLLLEAMARGDEAEAGRLRGSCPRKTYTQADAEFDDRLSLAFDVAAVVCIDLRGMWGKLHVLHWAIASVRHFATLHHINADMAFLDGARCAQGLPQVEFFATPPWPLPADVSVAAEEGGDDGDDDDSSDGSGGSGGDDDLAEADDEAGTPDPRRGGGDGDEPDHADGGERDEGDSGLSDLGEDCPRRMMAVEDRAEHASGLIARVLARAAREVAQDLIDVWAAFDRFCRGRVGVGRGADQDVAVVLAGGLLQPPPAGWPGSPGRRSASDPSVSAVKPRTSRTGRPPAASASAGGPSCAASGPRPGSRGSAAPGACSPGWASPPAAATPRFRPPRARPRRRAGCPAPRSRPTPPPWRSGRPSLTGRAARAGMAPFAAPALRLGVEGLDGRPQLLLALVRSPGAPVDRPSHGPSC